VVREWYSKNCRSEFPRGFRPPDQGTVKDLMDYMATDLAAPIKDTAAATERTSGTSVQDEVQYLPAYDGEIPFGSEE